MIAAVFHTGAVNATPSHTIKRGDPAATIEARVRFWCNEGEKEREGEAEKQYSYPDGSPASSMSK